MRASKWIIKSSEKVLLHSNQRYMSTASMSLLPQKFSLHRETTDVFSKTLESFTLGGRSSQGIYFNRGNALYGIQRPAKVLWLRLPVFDKKRGLNLKACLDDHGTKVEGFQRTENNGFGEVQRQAHGSIHLIVGPMFAGKTTALIKRVEAEEKAGRTVALVKSDKDTRYGLTAVVSHDGNRLPCWAVPSLATFRAQIGEDAYEKLDVIGIDEAQFLKDLLNFSQVAADYEGKKIIIAGLDGDFLRHRFGSILDLIPIADSVVKLSAKCELCGKPAFFTFRKTYDREKELIGGTDVYMPVCRQHYFTGKVAKETTLSVLDAKIPSSHQSDDLQQMCL